MLSQGAGCVMRLVLLAAGVGGLSTAENQLIIFINHKVERLNAFRSFRVVIFVPPPELTLQQQRFRVYPNYENSLAYGIE